MTAGNVPTIKEPITDYESLRRLINVLPGPASGKVRVFRGQNMHYEKILASGSRPQKLVNASLFNIATRVVAQDVIGQIDINLELDMMMFWTQALAQHYGPGSGYLDVTHSLDMALWFALHEYHPVGVTIVFGSGTAPDPANDILRREELVAYPRWNNPAWLYVFDVDKWQPGDQAMHGHLIDLADAPLAFSSSPRMRAQSACLLSSGVDEKQTDLSDCLAAAPIPIAWPMTGAPGLDRGVEEVFPGPESDDWYRRFLSVPLAPQPDRSTPPQITLGHPLPVTIYMPERKERAMEVMQFENGLRPALLYTTMGNPVLEPYDPVSKKSIKHALSDATILVAESPLRFILPPSDYDGWNQELLWGEVNDSVNVFDKTSHPVGATSLQNVFVEFSPLESPGIGSPDAAHQELGVLRAAWLVRNGSGLGFSLFFQSQSSDQIMEVPLPRIQLDATTKTIQYEARTTDGSGGEKVEWKNLTSLRMIAKPLFTVLLILRELSPIFKAAPFPSLVVDAGTDSQKMFVRVSREGARLLGVQDSRSGKVLHFLRGLELGETFVGPEEQETLQLGGKLPYAKLDAAAIRALVAAKAKAFETAHPVTR
jgi:hypothetical protein